MFTIRHYDRLSKARIKDRVKGLIDYYGQEFVPPLHQRSSAWQQTFTSMVSNDATYYETILDHPVFVAYDKHTAEIAGFMSYVSGYRNEYLTGYNPSNYISTIIIPKEFRRRGVAKLLYETIIKASESSAVTTRTWSTNYPHIHLLKVLGFQLADKLIDHRGKGVHTVYYGLR